MLDLSHIPSNYPNADIQMFLGVGSANNYNYFCWVKPRGKTMCHILVVGNGGNGGNGVISANSQANGGGGGASGSQTSIKIPLCAIPDRLYLRLFSGGSSNYSGISLDPSSGIGIANTLIAAAPGYGGGNALGTAPFTAGAGGTTASTIGSANMPFGWEWIQASVSGNPGSAGGTASDGININHPVVGITTGGCGGEDWEQRGRLLGEVEASQKAVTTFMPLMVVLH